MSTRLLWLLAILISVLISGYLGYLLFAQTPSAKAGRQIFLPGDTTQGHHQIELACFVCHQPFQGTPQKACIDCHGEELKQAGDVHAPHKFTDPRNAAMLEQVDALHCVACHREHKPELVREMDVTVPNDFCFTCHSDVAQDRPDHKDFDANSCADGGCHNYHDEKALYEDFLIAHLHEADIKQPALLPPRNIINSSKKPLTEADLDAPLPIQLTSAKLKDWADSTHAKEGVNCSDCHQTKPPGGPTGPWKDKLDQKACEDCHKPESKGFLSGKHGMRVAQGMPPMQPALAKLPMKKDAQDKNLGCDSCHAPHSFDIRQAAVESCLTCHDDKHSLAFKQSAHFRLWQQEIAGSAEPGSGVSCASCHLPRYTKNTAGVLSTHVEHNQNMNLRPNEKMIRSVCMNCHGLGFTLDALADTELVTSNFNGKPKRHISSLDMVENRLRQKPKRNAPPEITTPQNQ